MDIAQELARRINGVEYGGLTAQVVANAKLAILDTIGVMLAGSRAEAPARLLRVPGIADPGPSLVLGFGTRVGALNAALVNGVSAHALDFDDVNIAMGGHPSAPLVPALLALADLEDRSGAELIAAFVAGFETETRIARAVNFQHYEKGWHPTATLGVFGAAAAAARMMKLTDAQVATALAIAASLSSGVKANFGTMTKPLHVGHCARNGLFAALLAREDYTANPQAFEHKQGFLNVFNGPGTFDTARMIEAWASPFDIERPGLGIKLYPCCGSAHASIDGMISLAERDGIVPADVEKIHARIHARRLAHIDRPDPRSDLDAKFSVQYCLARALLERRIVVDHFENGAAQDPAVRGLMRRIEVEPYTNPPPDTGDHYAVELTVTLKSGERRAIRQERPCGRRPEEPTPPERLKAKFESCAARAIAPEQIGEALAALGRLEAVASVRTLVATLQTPRTP